jgi:hypothetical protein
MSARNREGAMESFAEGRFAAMDPFLPHGGVRDEECGQDSSRLVGREGFFWSWTRFGDRG